MFEHIERVHIIGKAQSLNDEISAVDKIVQEMSQATEDIKRDLTAHSDSMFGEQFEIAVNSVVELSDIIYEKSYEINCVQHDLVGYIDRVDNFNNRTPSGLPPRQFNVQRVSVQAELCDDFLIAEDIQKLINDIIQYSQSSFALIDTMVRHKDATASIWRDPQYNQYSAFIDEVENAVKRGVVALTDYAQCLVVKLGILTQGS